MTPEAPRLKLLIVDDHPRVRRMIADVAGPLAGSVVECDDGARALEAYLRHRPDVVLMDVSMPDQDGIEATTAIRRVDPAARVVMVTEYDGVELREAARAAGACGFVLKDDLLELRKVLAHLAAAPPA